MTLVRISRDKYWHSGNLVLLVMNDRHQVLMRDGTWYQAEDGASLPEDAGVVLPASVIEPLVKAIEEFTGHATHAETEARVLREALDHERMRVDSVLRVTLGLDSGGE